MKNTLRLEEALMFIGSIYLFSLTDFRWWWYPALILAPDIGMLGYLSSPRVGAFFYNLFHHKGLAVVVMVLGWYFTNDWALLTGIILFGHSSLDRMLGYGLKYPDSFKNTHLGQLP